MKAECLLSKLNDLAENLLTFVNCTDLAGNLSYEFQVGRAPFRLLKQLCMGNGCRSLIGQNH